MQINNLNNWSKEELINYIRCLKNGLLQIESNKENELLVTNEKLEKALIRACEKLVDKDNIIDRYNRINIRINANDYKELLLK